MKATQPVPSSRSTPLDVHVLDGASVLPEVNAASLAAVVRLLARDNRVVIVEFNDDARTLIFYEQSAWLPAGLHIAGDGKGAIGTRVRHG